MSEPAEQLAERIVEKLLAEDVIRGVDASMLRERLAAGEVSEAQWLELIEDALSDAGASTPEAVGA